MILLTIFSLLAVFMTTKVECAFSSAGSSASSASDGSGHTLTQSNNNGQGQFMLTSTRPGGVGVTTGGAIPPNPNQFPNQFPNQALNPFYGPASFGQPAFGMNYGPSFPYNPYGTMMPPYTPYPQPPAYGFNSPFQPLQTLSPYQPFQPLQPFSQPLATPQEFGAYLNGIQQQYNTYYKQQQELLNAWKNTPFVAGYSGVPNYAYSTGTFGPNGIQQTAGVYPPNKNNPNVDNRFNPSDNAANNVPGGFFGIQTSSFSSSSDVNGKKTHKEGAVTTVNDNGKVTTFKVDN